MSARRPSFLISLSGMSSVRRRTRAVGVALASVVLATLAACGQPQAPLPAIVVVVDPTIEPSAPAMPGFEDGEPRPLAAVATEDGLVADFVANEVWLSTADTAELDAFLARWNGTVLSTFDPADYTLTGMNPQYLVRIDTAAVADPAATLAADLRTLDPHATGTHGVSSQQGLDLLGATSQEAAAGRDVGINWVGSGAGPFTDLTSLEAPTGQPIAGIAYTPDAFSWPSHAASAEQEIGVAQAWRALDLSGKLGNRVKIAVLDMGFEPDDDTPAGWIGISNVPLTSPTGTENLLWCGGGNDCPWHGQNVVSASMALADNGFGGAGSAGPIAQPILVYTLYDFFTSITALGEARIAGARIANMSYSAPVPWYLGWSVVPFEGATAAFRAMGMLIFAAAGNEGKDVDSEGCTFGVCWERTWHTPCENSGVICVGGMAGGKTTKAPNSNYGADQVDIFAPFTLWLGPDPANPGNVARAISGTSFSSPFAAGVAALIWAADPSLGAGEVESLLMNTAHDNDDSRVKRHVNALGAVQVVLGNIPPSLTLPPSGNVSVNVPVSIQATVTDFEDPFPCCTVTWSSDVDGAFPSGYQLDHTFTTLGPRTITVTVTDSDGAPTVATIVLTVVNDPPEVTIGTPATGADVFEGAGITLRGNSVDPNEDGGALPCSSMVWTSSVAGDAFPDSGCVLPATFATVGERTITLTGTDDYGVSDSASIVIDVIEAPENLPPTVYVSAPTDGSAPNVDQTLALTSVATDPEGNNPLTYQWTVALNGGTPIVIGNSASIQWKPRDTYLFNTEGAWNVEVRLNVTDSLGNVGTDYVTLRWYVIL
jgi:hypothetical protein